MMDALNQRACLCDTREDNKEKKSKMIKDGVVTIPFRPSLNKQMKIRLDT